MARQGEIILQLLNKVRVDGGYASRMGEITGENLLELTHNFTPDDYNKFLDLMNMIAMTRIQSAQFDRTDNPFADFYREPIKVGGTVRNIYVDYIKGYDLPLEGTARGEFASVKPNLLEAYYNVNYKMQYKITYTLNQIREAFQSLEQIDSLNNQIMNSLYNSANYDNMLSDCQIFGTALWQKALVLKEVEPLTSEDNIKKFMEQFKNTVDNIRFNTKLYNASGLLMRTQLSDLVFITTPELLNKISVQWLAGVFNLSEVEMYTKIIKVPKEYGYGITTNSDFMFGMLVDKRFLWIMEQLYTTSVKYVDGPLYYNMFHTQTFIKNYSPFFNAVAFVSTEANREITITAGKGVTITGDSYKGSAGKPAELAGSFGNVAMSKLYLEFEGIDDGIFSGETHKICSYIELPTGTWTSTSVTLPSAPWKDATLVKEKAYSVDNVDSDTKRFQY